MRDIWVTPILYFISLPGAGPPGRQPLPPELRTCRVKLFHSTIGKISFSLLFRPLLGKKIVAKVVQKVQVKNLWRQIN